MVWAVVWCGLRLLGFFFPFVIGWVIAMIANPLVRFLEKRVKIVRKHSSIVLIVGVLGLVTAGLYFLIVWLLREMSGFIQALPELFELIQVEVGNAYQEASHLFAFIPSDMEDTFEAGLGNLTAFLGNLFQSGAASAGGAVARTIPEMFVNVIVVLVSSYLFLTEHDRITAFLTRCLPLSVKQYGTRFNKDLKAMIGGYFMAQFKIMFVVAVILLAGFLFLGVKYAVFLAVGIAVLDFLPMFGTGTALIPWAVVKLFTGEYAYAFGLIIIYVVSQVVRQIIQPKIVGDSMGLSPLATLFFLYIGFKFRGLAGMILAVPVGLVFIRLYQYGMFDSMIDNVRLLIRELDRLRREEDK